MMTANLIFHLLLAGHEGAHMRRVWQEASESTSVAPFGGSARICVCKDEVAAESGGGAPPMREGGQCHEGPAPTA